MPPARSLRHAGLLSLPVAERASEPGQQAQDDAGSLRLDEVVGDLERLLRTTKDRPDAAERRRVEHVLTDGSALLLALERERLRVKRRGRAALLDVAADPGAAQDADRLDQALGHLTGRIDALRDLLGRVRHRHAVVPEG